MEKLRIGADGRGMLDFPTGSTGILYIHTSDKSADEIKTLIQAGSITYRGAPASPERFLVTEILSGEYGGFTQVTAVVPEPETLALAAWALCARFVLILRGVR
jgi:hypothetical protein